MHQRAKLWSRSLLAAIGAVTVVSVVAVGTRPTGSDASQQLSIALDTLRSEVAEASLLAERAARAELTRRFVIEHARQLEDRMRDAAVDVATKGRKAGAASVAAEAGSHGSSAVAALGRIEARPDSVVGLRADAAALAADARALSRLNQSVQATAR